MKVLSPLPVSFSGGWTHRCSAVVTPDVRQIFEEGLWLLVRFPAGPRISPSLWPPGKQRSRMREGIEKGHSSDLWPDVAIGYLQLRDGFCSRGAPKQTPPAPPANVGLRFQPFRGRSLAFRVKRAVAEIVKLDVETAFFWDNKQGQHSSRFLRFSCRVHAQMSASCCILEQHYITDSTSAVLDHSCHSLDSVLRISF